MEARGGGRIVNGLSAGAFMPGGIYGVSKFALHGLTVNLASELGGRGINVNAIAPGLVDNESGYVALPKDSPFRDAIAADDPRQAVGPARGPRRHAPAAVLARPATGSPARRSSSTAAGSPASDRRQTLGPDALALDGSSSPQSRRAQSTASGSQSYTYAGRSPSACGGGP